MLPGDRRSPEGRRALGGRTKKAAGSCRQPFPCVLETGRAYRQAPESTQSDSDCALNTFATDAKHVILHADLDAFYAAIAQRDDPTLCGKPLVVAGSSRRAVVLTASYEARPFGIASAMPLYVARARCPQLIVVPPQYGKYRETSDVVFEILERHADTVEALSLDEAFLDLGAVAVDGAVAAAREIKEEVRATTALTISIGAASGKMVAKIASDDGKPDGLVAVPPGTEAVYLANKPVRRLWGIGPKTETRLKATGIERIGQIAELSDKRAHELFGRWGVELRALARGIDPRPVIDEDAVRSISSEETFEYDVKDFDVLTAAVRSQTDELAERLVRKALQAYTIGVKIKLSNFKIVGRQTSLMQPTDDVRMIYRAAVFCLRRAGVADKAIRLIGTRVSGLVPHRAEQIGLFKA